MTARRRSRSRWGRRPSALSARPSMCSRPVRARSAATTSTAATAGRPDVRRAPPHAGRGRRRSTRRRGRTRRRRAGVGGRARPDDGEEAQGVEHRRYRGRASGRTRPAITNNTSSATAATAVVHRRRARRGSGARSPSTGARRGRPRRTRARCHPGRPRARRGGHRRRASRSRWAATHVPRASTRTVPSGWAASAPARSAPASTVAQPAGRRSRWAAMRWRPCRGRRSSAMPVAT